MKLLVSGSTVSTKKYLAARPDRVGVLLTPHNGNNEWWGEDVFFACDNSCFGGLDTKAFLKMLGKISEFKSQPKWVTVPDVVGDAAATIEQFNKWAPTMEMLGLKLAFVRQDGLSAGQVPWEKIACLFVGGSDEWKDGPTSAAIVTEAKARGKLVHAGRVNTAKRIARFARLNADTFDGTAYSRWGDVHIPKAIRFVDEFLDLFKWLDEESPWRVK